MIFIIWLIIHIFDEYTNQKHTVYIYTIYPFKQSHSYHFFPWCSTSIPAGHYNSVEPLESCVEMY